MTAKPSTITDRQKNDIVIEHIKLEDKKMMFRNIACFYNTNNGVSSIG